MSEDKILLNIESNLDKYTKEAAESQKVIDGLTDAIDRMKKGGEASSEEIEQAKTQLRLAKKEYRESVKSIDDVTRATTAQAGSYQELQAQLRLAEKELKTQSGLITKNADGTIKLSDAYVKASAEVENARGAVNSFNLGVNNGTTNVGLYQQSIEKAMGGLNIFGTTGSKAFGMLQGGFSSFIKTSLMGLKTLAKALLSNPVGLIILVVVGAVAMLVKAWKSFTDRYYETTDKMAAVVEAIKAAFDALVDVFVNFFSGADQSAKSIKEVYLETKKLAEEARKLKDEMKEFEQSSAKAKLEITKLELVYKDLAKSDEERMAAAKAAMAIELQRSDQELAMAKENLRIIAEKNALTKSGREDKEAEIEAQTKVYELEEASLKKRVKINATLSGLENQMRKDRENYANKEKRAVIDLMKLRANDNIDSLKNVLKQEYELSIANEELTKTERLLVKAQYHAAVLALDNKEKQELAAKESAFQKELEAQQLAYTKLAEEQEEQRRLNSLEAYEKRKADRIKRNEDELTLERLKHEEKLMLGELTAEQEYLSIKSILESQRALTLSNKLLSNSEIAIAEQEFQNQMLINEQNYTNAKKEISDIRVRAAIEEAQAISNAMGSLSDLMGKETALGKSFALAQATINTYLAGSQVLSDPTIPTVTKVAAMIGILATGFKNVKEILSVKVKGSSGGGGASAPRGGGGYVATRAGGAIASSNTTLPSIGSNLGSSKSQQANNSSDDIVNAIKDIKVYTIIDDVEKGQRNKAIIEEKANY